MHALQKANLVHLLIQYNSESQQEDIKAHRLKKLNQVAISLYDAAFQEAGRDFSDTAHYFDKENQAIKKRVISELELANLSNDQQFNAMILAIKAWHQSKTARSVERQCQKIRQILISVAPKIIQKQKLLRICNDYKAYLKKDIEAQLCLDHSQDMEQFVADYSQGMSKGSQRLNATITKYIAISSMYSALITPYRIETQITQFKREFLSNRSIIEKNRDSQTIKFVKKIVTILSLGIAHALGIWNVHGKKVSENIKTVLGSNETQLSSF